MHGQQARWVAIVMIVLAVSTGAWNLMPKRSPVAPVPPPSSAPQANDDWRPYVSKPGRFEVRFPPPHPDLGPDYNPVAEKKEDTGQTTLHIAMVTVGKGSGFGAMYADHAYSDEEMQEIGFEEKKLDGARDGVLSDPTTKLVSEKKARLNGYPGREIRIDKGDQMARYRVFLVGKRMYIMVVIGPPGFIDSKFASTFLMSLKLLD